MAEDMADLQFESEVWKQIDLSESYMVSGMFEEAASLAASVIKQIRTTNSVQSPSDTSLVDMMESAGMVLIQSSKELGRTREQFDELKMLFGSVAAIPVQVFLTGACMQISEGYAANLMTIFEEFLINWVYLKDEVKVLPKAELHGPLLKGCFWQSTLDVEKYLEVADVYAITILGMSLHKLDAAISWTEKAELPEEKRQDMLRRLESLRLAAHSSSSLCSGTTSTAKGTDSAVPRGKSYPKTTELQKHDNGDELKPTSLKSIQCISDRTVRSKLGNLRLLLPRGKTMFLSSLILFTFYILRRRRAVLQRFVARQASAVRRALIDAWQLAFSVQVNPLAAVQQLPSAASRGSR